MPKPPVRYTHLPGAILCSGQMPVSMCKNACHIPYAWRAWPGLLLPLGSRYSFAS
jgi:hypothetical protein